MSWNIMKLFLVILFVVDGRYQQQLSDIYDEHHNWTNWRFSNAREYQQVLLERILGVMDTRFNPCDDFYEYACGNYENYMRKFGWPRSNVFHELKVFNELTISRIVASDVVRNSTRSERLLKRFFSSCLRVSNSNPSVDEYVQGFASWPAYDPLWSAQNFDWMKVVVDLLLSGINTFIEVKLDTAGHHNEIIALVIGMISKLTAPRSFHVLQNNYRKIFKNTTVPVEYVDDMARRLYPFLVQLNQIKNELDSSSGEARIYEYQQHLPEWDLARLISLISGQPSDSSKVIIIQNLDYMKSIGRLIQNTPMQTVADFLFSNTFIKTRALVTRLKAMDHAKLSEYCVGAARKHMSPVVTSLFVRESFSRADKLQVRRIVQRLQQVGATLLKEAGWMDEATKWRAIRKMQIVKKYIGYPDYIDSERELGRKYSRISIEEDNFLHNLKQLKKLQLTMDYSLHGNSSQLFPDDPLTVDPSFRLASKGSLHLQVAFLQPPVYHKFNPSFVNYGAVVTVAGHELMHNFDVEGLEYDENGQKSSWLSASSLAEYFSRTACFSSQFEEFKVDGTDLNVKGTSTLSENVADSDGLKMAFVLFKEWMRQNPRAVEQEASEFAPLQLSHEQAFFLSYAQLWCSYTPHEDLINQIQNGDHSPPKYRILGSVSNFAEFATAFECAPDMRLNRQKKCNYFFNF